jgi:hypothetical protein
MNDAPKESLALTKGKYTKNLHKQQQKVTKNNKKTPIFIQECLTV